MHCLRFCRTALAGTCGQRRPTTGQRQSQVGSEPCAAGSHKQKSRAHEHHGCGDSGARRQKETRLHQRTIAWQATILARGWRERGGCARDRGERFIGHARDTARRGHRRHTAAETTTDLGIWSFVLHGVGRRGWISCALLSEPRREKQGAAHVEQGFARCTWFFFFCAIHDRTLNSHVFRYQFCSPPDAIHGPDVLIASLSQLGCWVIFCLWTNATQISCSRWQVWKLIDLPIILGARIRQ